METDWKEKYEGAIKKVELLRGYSVEGNAKIDELFPELAESKDEKIRKDIISLVNEWWDRIGIAHPEFSTRGEMLAYLEKQKEQKSNIEICPHTTTGKSYLENGYPIEQKPVEPSDDELQRNQKELYDFKVFAAKQAKEQEGKR